MFGIVVITWYLLSILISPTALCDRVIILPPFERLGNQGRKVTLRSSQGWKVLKVRFELLRSGLRFNCGSIFFFSFGVYGVHLGIKEERKGGRVERGLEKKDKVKCRPED